MPRPQRRAATRKFNYKDTDSEEEETPSSSSDEDDDFDPDKVTIPGGGTNVQSLTPKTEVKKEEKPVAASSGSEKTVFLGTYQGKPIIPATMKTDAGNTKPTFNLQSPQAMSAQLIAKGLVSKSSAQPTAESLNLSSMLGGSSLGQFSPGNIQALLAQVMNKRSDPRMNGMINYPGMMGQQMYPPGMYGQFNMMGQQQYPYGFPSPYYMGQDMKGGMLGGLMGVEDQKEEEEDDEEELGHTETFADYMPTKLKIGIKHPDPVVETASLASVTPPNVWYDLSLPDDIVKKGKLSALQLEAVVYACQQHERFLPSGERAGYLIGDGAGVGKGRTIAGIIYENYLKGRKKAIWVSVSSDLKFDSERDLKDIGATNIDVYPLNKMKYAKITSPVNGNVKKGVIYSTYSSLIGESQSGGKYRTRLKQLVHWAGENFEGVIVFDECHRAKNLCPVGGSKPTKTGTMVAELQKQLPRARVVYASATGASEPKNMAYVTRLGIWGKGSAFNEFQDFISSVEKRGVGAMEIVAMDMKLRGTYIARQLSFQGVSFKIEEVPLGDDFINMYNDSVKLWVEARDKFQKALNIMDVEGRMNKTMWGQFWSSHQRFFKYLCIAAKVRHVVRLATDAIKMGKCVVIGLQSTGEARTLDQLEKEDGELSDFVSTAKGVFETLIEKHFPAPDRNKLTKILGIENSQFMKDLLKEMKNGDDGAAAGSSSGHKRKPERAAKSKAAKRVKTEVSDSESEEDESEDEKKSESASGCDSDFRPSGSDGSESYESETSSEGSNPFEDDSDAEDPWLGGGKKRKGSTKKPKKKKKTKTKNPELKRPPPSKDAVETAIDMKADLLSKLDTLSEKLPPNTLDELIDELGGTENVSEMTGRKGRVVQEGGQVKYESRSECDIPLELLNIKEKERFMQGQKDIAIISEAASSGISLQSDRRVKNQRRRVHITLELPWSADRAIQQFGRTHRSNQVNAPEYVFLISDLAGERRFASIVAKRLESLGALTHGDRRATESRDLSRFNIDNKYGRSALEATMKTIMGYESPMVPPPKDYKGNFFKDCQNALVGVGLITPSENFPNILTLDKDYNNMSKFLNRILGLPVVLQNSLFKYFTDVLSAIISQAKKMGRYDLGILDLGSGSGDKVRRLKLYTFLGKHATGSATTELHQVQVERGMSWDESQEKSKELSGDKDEGYYISYQTRNGKQNAILAISCEISSPTKKKKDSERMFALYRPNTGLQVKQESFSDLKKKYKKVEADQAEPHWTEQYEASTKTCSHAYWRGNCRRVTLGMECEIGLRTRTYHLLSGSVLNVWTQVEGVLSSMRNTPNSAKMQVIRVRTNDGLKIVGTLIPNNAVDTLMEVLKSKTDEFSETVL